jgi:prolycopene isomerase
VAYQRWITGNVQCFTGIFLEAGGEARFNCGVEKILTQDGKISAVRLEDGSIHSCHAVISNASPILTFNELLDIEAPEKIKLT